MDPANPWQTNISIGQGELIISDVESIMFTFPLKRRSFCTSSEKIAESSLQIHKGLRMAIPVNIAHPRKQLWVEGVELLLELEGGWRSSRFILPIPFGQAPIENEPMRTNSTAEVSLLLTSQIQSNLVRQMQLSTPSVDDTKPADGRSRHLARRQPQDSCRQHDLLFLSDVPSEPIPQLFSLLDPCGELPLHHR